MTAREPGRQGPSSDPNRDGCGPAVLILLGVLVALVLLAGCRETSPPSPRPSTTSVTSGSPTISPPPPAHLISPGAYCSPAGATGTTADGAPMECAARPGDDRARWRQP